MKRLIILLLILNIVILSPSILAQQKGMKRPEKLADQIPNEMVYRKGWVLAVGVNEYPNLPSKFWLNYAVPDAKAFVELLQSRFGFDKNNIILLTNAEATKQNIMEKFYSFANPKWVDREDCVLFYFSGHGQTVSLPRGGDVGFLIPYDAKVDLSQEANVSEYKQFCIGMNELNETAKLIPAKHIIFIVDACYSGLAIESTRSLRSDIPGYLSKVAKSPTQHIIAAGMQGEESQERAELGHGVFTYKLLEGLENEVADMNNDGVITGTELSAYLSESVRSKSNGKQNPQWRKADEGEFLFLPQFKEQKAPPKPAELIEDIKPIESTLSVDSDPKGASVYIDGQEKGKTPCTIKVDVGAKGEKEFIVSVSMEGYETRHGRITMKVGENKRWADVRLNKLVEVIDVSPEPVRETLPQYSETKKENAIPNSKKEITGRDGARMALIPAGEFQMGRSDGDTDEQPAHRVYTDSFYMDVFEVTNAQYRKFVDATGYSPPAYWSYSEYNAPDQPVVGVSWDDAMAYCTWAGKRLPTEAEWEKAARGGLMGKNYPWGDNISHDNANYFSTEGRDIWSSSSPVGRFDPNGCGLYDMSGNVWEWCADWYDMSYYSSSPLQNPNGPASSSERVLRGGAWNVGMEYLHVTKRYSRYPTYKYFDLGFRCVMDAK